MKNLSVQVDEEFFRQVKITATKKDMSLKDYIIGLIKKDLDEEQKESDTYKLAPRITLTLRQEELCRL